MRPKTLRIKHYNTTDVLFACKPDRTLDPFTLMMPPPDVTGTLHLGHALTYTLQDVLVRSKRTRGFDSLWQPRTDHAGIATQMVEERNLAQEGTRRHDVGRDTSLEKSVAMETTIRRYQH